MFKLLVLLLSLLVSCSSGTNEFKVGLSQEPNTLDLHNTTSQVSRFIMLENVLERIIVIDNNQELHPALINSWEFSNNNKTLKLNLKDDLYFSNQDKVKPSDFLFSLNRWIDSSYSARVICGNNNYFEIENNSLIINSNQSLVFLPYYMASSKQAAVLIQEDTNSLINKPIGTGPYYLDSWTIGSNVVLKKVENYKTRDKEDILDLNGEKKALFPSITYSFIPDDFARVAALEKEEIYFMNDLPFDYLNNDFEKGEVYKDNVTGTFVLLLNKAEGVLQNKTIRQALEIGLDKNRLMMSCYTPGSYELNLNYMQSTSKDFQVDLEYNQNDKQTAIKMIKTAKAEGSTIRVLSSNLSNMDKTAMVLKDELTTLGFNVELVIRDWASYLELREDKSSFDIAITALTNDSIPSQKLFFSSNYPGWTEDAKLSTLLEEFNNSESLEAASVKWKEVQNYCYDYIPVIVLGHYKTAYLVSQKLKDVIYNNGFYFYSAYLDN